MPPRPKRTRPKSPAKTTSAVETLPPPPVEDLSDAETLEFLQAIDAYKRSTGKPFPSWTEILQIVKSLGYRKVGGDDR